MPVDIQAPELCQMLVMWYINLRINLPFGEVLYQLFMVILGIVLGIVYGIGYRPHSWGC